MTITLYNEGRSMYICPSEGATIFEVMEDMTNLLLSAGYNYKSILEAHQIEAERMEEAITYTQKYCDEKACDRDK